jgi:hypothetical protein
VIDRLFTYVLRVTLTVLLISCFQVKAQTLFSIGITVPIVSSEFSINIGLEKSIFILNNLELNTTTNFIHSENLDLISNSTYIEVSNSICQARLKNTIAIFRNPNIAGISVVAEILGKCIFSSDVFGLSSTLGLRVYDPWNPIFEANTTIQIDLNFQIVQIGLTADFVLPLIASSYIIMNVEALLSFTFIQGWKLNLGLGINPELLTPQILRLNTIIDVTNMSKLLLGCEARFVGFRCSVSLKSVIH